MNVWLIIVGMGIVTFGIRLSFIGLIGQRPIAAALQRALLFVPVAVLSALIVPDVVVPQGISAFSLTNGRLIAGVLAGIVAWRTKNVFLTLAVGMGVLYAVQALTR